MRRLLLSFLLAVAVTGPGVSGIPPAEAAEEATITFTDRANPATLTVAPGTTVSFANRSGERRRVRSKDGPVEFDSGNLEPGAGWSVTLHTAGTYAYVDERDRDDTAYHGTITVGSTSPPPNGSPGAPGGSAPPAGSPAPSAPTSASVAILDRSFSPATVTVAAGGTVSWTNQSDRDHTVTGAGFDSGGLGGSGRFSHTFPTAGTFAYVCDFHSEMRASVVVTSGAGGATQPVPPPAAAPAPSAPAAGPGPAASPAAPPPATTGSGAATRHTVVVADYAFRPATVSARVGDTVVWTNQGRAPHTATAAGVFDTGMFRAGEQRTTTLTKPGTIAFRCTVHPEMTGELRVAAAAGGAIPGPAQGAAAIPGGTASGAGDRPATPPPASPAGPSGSESTPGTAEVSVVDFAFEPAAVRVATGGTVTWRLTGSAPHTVTGTGGSFDSGLLEPGATFSHRFDAAGTYGYVCAFHPQMTGTAEVVEPSSPVPDATSGVSAGRGAGATGEQTAAHLTDPRDAPASWIGLLVAASAVAAILAGTGVLLYGGSRMLAAGAAN